VVSLDPPDPATRRVIESVDPTAGVGSDGLTLFHDEMRQPILAEDLAIEIWRLLALDRAARAGVWHLPGAQVLSRLELGRRVCARVGADDSALRSGSQADAPGPRPRDLTMVAARRPVLGHPPTVI
jgi:dTDP-4-dehydrorhamnose reductase